MYVFANATTAVRWRGGVVRLQRGQVWDKKDPFVKDRPEFFDSEPTKVTSTRGHNVEQATAAPGEKRTKKGDG